MIAVARRGPGRRRHRRTSPLVTLYAASAADLLVAVSTTALASRSPSPAPCASERARRSRPPLLRSLSALVGGWALVAWGTSMDSDVAARALALAVYAGMVGVLASPLARRASTRLVPRGVSGGARGPGGAAYSGDEDTTAMVLTIVGTAICVVAVTTRDRALLGWVGRGGARRWRRSSGWPRT